MLIFISPAAYSCFAFWRAEVNTLGLSVQGDVLSFLVAWSKKNILTSFREPSWFKRRAKHHRLVCADAASNEPRRFANFCNVVFLYVIFWILFFLWLSCHMSYFACSWGGGGWGGLITFCRLFFLAGALNFKLRQTSAFHAVDAMPQLFCLGII